MIYVTGDTHGRQEKWLKEIHHALSPGDTIIITGDFGVGFWNGKYFSEETFYDYIITHTASIESIQYLSTNGDIGIKPILKKNSHLLVF